MTTPADQPTEAPEAVPAAGSKPTSGPPDGAAAAAEKARADAAEAKLTAIEQAKADAAAEKARQESAKADAQLAKKLADAESRAAAVEKQLRDTQLRSHLPGLKNAEKFLPIFEPAFKLGEDGQPTTESIEALEALRTEHDYLFDADASGPGSSPRSGAGHQPRAGNWGPDDRHLFKQVEVEIGKESFRESPAWRKIGWMFGHRSKALGSIAGGRR